MNNRVFQGLRRAYHLALKPEIRQRLGLGRLLAELTQRWAIFAEKNSARTWERAGKVSSPRTEKNGILDIDFINSMVWHNPAAVGLARTIEKLGNGAIVVTIMEEAAIASWLAQAARRFPYLVSLHTLESKCLKDIYSSDERYKAEKWLLSAACNGADQIIFPSKGCCKDLVEEFSVSDSKIQRIWNPVDCAGVRRLSYQKLEAVENWRNKFPVFRMVHVGRLDPQKNHDLLLSACAELVKRRRKFSLAIIGEGLSKMDIESNIRRLGLGDCVQIVGEQKNPFPWIAAADALLLTSRFEAFALVLVEAMVCGTPAISVDCPAGPVEVLNQGEFGLLVPNDDPMALADAVERLMDDPELAKKMVGLGYERAQVFDVKNIVPQWESLIDAVPQRHG